MARAAAAIVIEVQQRGGEWLVLDRDAVVSIHPTRDEAERAALWLVRAASTENASRVQMPDNDAFDGTIWIEGGEAPDTPS